MRATAAQKALGLATMATPWGMIAGLVAGAATALAVFGGKSKEASEGQDELKQKMDEANAAMKVQFAQLNTINETWATFSDDKNKLSAQQLRDAIQAINDELDRGSTTAERRRQYTTALQEADGNYIETQEEANKRQKEHNENLIKQRNEYEKLLKQKEKNLKGDEKELGAYEALNKRIGEYLKLLQNQAVLNNISSSNVDKYKKSVLELQAAQERLNNALKNQPIETVDSFETMNTDLDKLNTLFITAQKSAEGFRVKLDELPTAYNADEEARRRFILDMEEIASASSALGSAIGNFGNTLTEVFGKAAEDNAAFAGFLKGITILEITFSQASAIAQAIAKIAAGDPLSVITGAISLVSSITALFGGIISQIEGAEVPSPPAFAEGTPYVSLNGNPSGVDTIPAYLNEGEAVIPTDRNKKYPGLASAWINNKLDDYIMSNWVAPAIESERNKSFADNLAEAIKVSGVFDDYRLYRAISEQTSVNKSGFKKLDKVISRSVNPRLRYD